VALKVIDLFCGAGGSTLGFKKAGFEVILGVDIDEVALSAYNANHPEIETWQRNILTITADELPEADVVLGSTPCAPFSKINQFSRSFDMTLTNHFLKLIREYEPKFWVLENVPPIIKHLPKWVPYEILNAADYGVPQRRYRCMAGNYPFPSPTHSENDNERLEGEPLRKWVTFGRIKHSEGSGILSKKALEGVYRRANVMGMKGNRYLLQFIEDDEIVPTLCASEFHGLRAGSTVVYDEGRLRKLSWMECMRAQSFPDDYIFQGTQEQKFHQLGDAVPPLLAEAIAKAILSKNEDGELK
jgi:DNA (cytosine-5)-methyltransferase 1